MVGQLDPVPADETGGDKIRMVGDLSVCQPDPELRATRVIMYRRRGKFVDLFRYVAAAPLAPRRGARCVNLSKTGPRTFLDVCTSLNKRIILLIDLRLSEGFNLLQLTKLTA